MDADDLPTAIDRARRAFKDGQLDVAAAIVDSLLKTDAACLDALEVKAMVLQSRGDRAGAELTLRQAIAAAPERHWPYDDLARLLLEAGRPADAEIVVRAALAADGTNANAHGMLGVMLSEREELMPGAWHLRRAIGLAGRHPQLLAGLGRNLARQGALEEAEALLREAVEQMPDQLVPRVHLAEVVEQRGRLDEAKKLLAAAGAIARRQGQDVTLQEAALAARTADWRSGLAALDAVCDPAGGALLLRGRLRDRAGRFEEAWADFVAGKAKIARATGRHYSRDKVEGHIAELRTFFSANRFAALPRAGVRRDVPQPIFILGFPRSGTTLTEQVLTSHSRVRAGGELPFAAELRDFGALTTGAPFPAGLGALAAADQSHLPALFRDFYLARAESHGLLAPGADFFTDKMPLNELYLPLLCIAFPEAPKITVARHPLDVMVSVMAHDMTHGFNCAYEINDAAHHLAALSELDAHYRDALGIVRHELIYERFVAAQESETSRLMAYLGLKMESAQLRFHESTRFAPTPSYAQVQEPLNDRSIGRWRHYARELEPVRDVLDDAMARAGYAG
ncbi:MAG: sulfotransferase [Sphingomonas sp.]